MKLRICLFKKYIRRFSYILNYTFSYVHITGLESLSSRIFSRKLDMGICTKKSPQFSWAFFRLFISVARGSPLDESIYSSYPDIALLWSIHFVRAGDPLHFSSQWITFTVFPLQRSTPVLQKRYSHRSPGTLFVEYETASRVVRLQPKQLH